MALNLSVLILLLKCNSNVLWDFMNYRTIFKTANRTLFCGYNVMAAKGREGLL